MVRNEGGHPSEAKELPRLHMPTFIFELTIGNSPYWRSEKDQDWLHIWYFRGRGIEVGEKDKVFT